MKLPKQWKDWCRSAGLRPRGRGRANRDPVSWLYLHGRGREWRLNCHNMLQCGDTYTEFDRWAICDIREVPAPKSRDEFVAAVNSLVAAHEV